MPKEIIKEIVAYTALVRRMGKDPCLFATHVSLFTAMFVCWQRNGFVQPFSVCRRELMVFSKIASVATYHKCIRDLDNNGYISYQPSYHPKTGSLIFWPGC
ncbi:MAG TPA: hypothetical protein DIT07_11980 [Sphingobacteriaceae bacterium]|nr:hypothetical protein [Sphingobacteriaceae bacterium]